MHPVLASDFTGLLELVIWLWANGAYAVVLVIAWLLLIFKRTRSAGTSLFRALIWAGVLLLIVVALQIYPMIFHRDDRDDFLIVGGISLGLFFAAYGTRHLLTRTAWQRRGRI